MSFADHRGRLVVVNVWGSWCSPCVAEQPDLVEAAEQLADTADFVGINIRETSAENAQAFVRSYDVPYPSIYDPDSKALLSFSEVVPVRSPPTTFVLDEEGRIAAAIFGALPSVGTPVDVVEELEVESGG
ncbi:TlpA family protein disulfide reductase [Nocardioides sp. B-3]|uniref:TlpA family protein disulfide reductase n=1 Tax=Nocardioides sp. B-3 TaxID=2895565 RepID=UPI0021520F09|nr:TlpA disulfide reductase family protein [Nocardioides sp. B-3]UUZ61614.1 TlpA family protein disulfide reductase [Nocardioides sp. B-3]